MEVAPRYKLLTLLTLFTLFTLLHCQHGIHCRHGLHCDVVYTVDIWTVDIGAEGA